MEYKSYAFTVRPRDGLTPELERRLKVWLSKQDYAFAVTEMEAEARHMHGQIFSNIARTKSSVQVSLERIQESCDPNWCPASKKVLRRGVKIAYSNHFIDEYLNKSDSKIIYNNPPEEESEFYPSEEEQKKVKEQAQAVDKRLYAISILYQGWRTDNKDILDDIILREERIARFLYDAWYISKTLPTLQNLKQERELARRVRNYIYPYQSGFMDLIAEQQKKYIKKEILMKLEI